MTRKNLLLGALVVGLLIVGIYVYLAFSAPVQGRVVFSEYGGDLCILASTWWQRRCLDDGHYPSWSPDGEKIVFSRVTLENSQWNIDIYTVESDGSNLTRLTDDSGTEDYPAWSPDGEEIVFSLGCNLYVVDSNGTSKRALLEADSCARFPTWSPDGEKIAFALLDDTSNAWGVYVVYLNDHSLELLTSGFAYASRPVWSPSGEQIAFEAQGDGNLDIYVMNADGSGITRLTDHPNQDAAPTWSPDGQLIAFLSGRGGKQWRSEGGFHESYEIYLMNRDGTEQRRLARWPSGAIEGLDWIWP